MAYALFGNRPLRPSGIARTLGLLIRVVRAHRAARARRRALIELLRMEPHRLDDMGLKREHILAELDERRRLIRARLSGRTSSRFPPRLG